MYLCLQVTNGCQQDAIEAAHGRAFPDELHWWCEMRAWVGAVGLKRTRDRVQANEETRTRRAA